MREVVLSRVNFVRMCSAVLDVLGRDKLGIGQYLSANYIIERLDKRKTRPDTGPTSSRLRMGRGEVKQVGWRSYLGGLAQLFGWARAVLWLCMGRFGLFSTIHISL